MLRVPFEMFIAIKKILFSFTWLTIYIFILTQIMQILFETKEACEIWQENQQVLSTQVLFGQHQALIVLEGSGTAPTLLLKGLQSSSQTNQTLSQDALRNQNKQISKSSLHSANEFKNKKELLFQQKSGLLGKVVSDFAWLSCQLQAGLSRLRLGVSVFWSMLPEPHASFASQLLFGRQSQGSRSLQQLFKVTGMSHILVISGFHLQLLVSLCLASITKIAPKNQAVVLVLLLTWVYVMMLGSSIPVVRATIMLTVALTARLLQRQYNSKAALAATALVLFMQDPSVSTSLSFQLSFAATAVILWIYPLFAGTASQIEHLSVRGLSKTLLESWLLGVVVSVSLSPLLSYHFGNFSLVSMLLSPLFSLSLPLLVCLLLLLLVAAAVGATVVASIAAGLFTQLLEQLLQLLVTASNLDFLSLQWQPSSLLLIGSWYASLFGLALYFSLIKRKRLMHRTKMLACYG